MNGDILSLINFSNLYDFAIQQNSLLTLAIKKEITPYDFGNIFFEGNRVTGIQEKQDIVMYILAGIYVMKPKIFKFFPENEYFGMDTLILNMIAKNEDVTKYDLKEYWLDIGRLDDFEKAQEIYKNHFENGT